MISNETLHVIRRRRSVRDYRDGQLSEEEMAAILEAGQYAPHAGEEAWHFTAIQNKELLRRLNLAAKEGARRTGVPFLEKLGNDDAFDCLYNAPALVIVSGDGRSSIPLHADCAAATQNMLLAAESMGIGSCWIYFVLMAFDSTPGAELLKELMIPEGYRPHDAAVFGYKKGPPAPAPERKLGTVIHIL